MYSLWHLTAYIPVQHRGSLLWRICLWEKLPEESEEKKIKEQETNYKLHAACVHQSLDFLLRSSLWQIISDAKSKKTPLKTPVQIEIKSKDLTSVTFHFTHPKQRHLSDCSVWCRTTCAVPIWPGRSLTLEQKQQRSVLAVLLTVANISNSAAVSWNPLDSLETRNVWYKRERCVPCL